MDDYVAIKVKDFQLLEEYVEDLKPDYYKAAKAVEVQRIFRTAQMVKVAPPEEVDNKIKK